MEESTNGQPADTPCLSIIVAMARNRVIGRDGMLPWRLSSDLQRFKQLTMGHTLIMGRTTYESIGKPLPGRRSIVLSGNPAWTAEGVHVCNCWTATLSLANSFETQAHSQKIAGVAETPGTPEIFVIGGARVFADALPLARRLHLTWVESDDLAGDTFFPPWKAAEWQLRVEQSCPASDRDEYPTTYCLLERPWN